MGKGGRKEKRMNKHYNIRVGKEGKNMKHTNIFKKEEKYETLGFFWEQEKYCSERADLWGGVNHHGLAGCPVKGQIFSFAL